MSVSAWMIFAAAVGALLAGAARVAEAAARQADRSTRWMWFAGIVLSVLVPLRVGLVGAGTALTPSDPEPMPLDGPWLTGEAVMTVEEGVWNTLLTLVGDLPAIVSLAVFNVAATLARIPGVDLWAVGLWGVASVALGVVLTVAWVRRHRGSRGWSKEVWQGRNVLVSADVGPAAFGLRRPRIVVPRWMEALPPREKDIVLCHEEEHVRGGDTWLLAVSTLALVALPWNPALWWQYRQLRQAMELDCDRRVLARGVRTSHYGALLVSVSVPELRHELAIPAFRGSRSLLERRLASLLRRRSRVGQPTALLAGAVALGLLTVACQTEAPGPSEASGTPPTPSATRGPATSEGSGARTPSTIGTGAAPAPSEAPSPSSSTREPEFTPFTVAPSVRNANEISDLLQGEYPSLLRDAGVGGRVVVWFEIDEHGTVQTARVAQSSGHPQLDAAAVRVAHGFAFTPAMNRGDPVRVWVQIPIQFQAR